VSPPAADRTTALERALWLAERLALRGAALDGALLAGLATLAVVLAKTALLAGRQGLAAPLVLAALALAFGALTWARFQVDAWLRSDRDWRDD
jgi:hypothetical protein